MSKRLGKLTQYGVLNPMNPVLAGGWTITFKTEDLPKIEAEIWHAAVQGPAASQFQVFTGDTFFDNVIRGDVNSLDPFQCMPVDPGENIYWHFNTAAGNPPKGTIFMREPSPL